MTEQIEQILDDASAALCRLDDAALDELVKKAEQVAALFQGQADASSIQRRQERLGRLVESTRGSLQTLEAMHGEGSGATWVR